MNQQLRRKLDHITDILWAGGVTNPVTYIEQHPAATRYGRT